MTYKSYSEAVAQLPDSAKWSCSFGYPGETGYVEYHRDQNGKRYVIENGKWSDFEINWTCKGE